ncbi:MAG: hypothetical protein ABI837_15675, partial [Acidobacteriota bacterium]
HARMLQLFPRNRASEVGLLETLPRNEEEATGLMSFGRVGLPRGKAIELRDEIRDDLPHIYWSAARRHREYIPRLLAAKQWMDACFGEEVDRLCAASGGACVEGQKAEGRRQK